MIILFINYTYINDNIDNEAHQIKEINKCLKSIHLVPEMDTHVKNWNTFT